MKQKDRYTFLVRYFSEHLPDAQTELHYNTPYELLVAVVLSAQCTDKRVNAVTPALFEAFPDFASLAEATPDRIFPYIQSISYPNSKSKYLHGLACQIMEKHGGKIPHEGAVLQKLPGVGRKTANVIASVLFQAPKMAVDTHVFRVSHRIGLVAKTDRTPLQVERKLTRHFPKALIHRAHHWLILHGRYTCQARHPKCTACGLQEACLYFSTGST